MTAHMNPKEIVVTQDNDPVIDSRLLRDALGKCPTGVSIVSADVDGTCEAMTIGSFASLSLEPALVMWNIQKSASRISHFTKAAHFEISVLAENQQGVADAYARRQADQLDIDHCDIGRLGALRIAKAAAHFECATWQIVDAGDHMIIIGEVLSVTHETVAAPLVFCGGRYARSLPDLQQATT